MHTVVEPADGHFVETVAADLAAYAGPVLGVAG